MQNQIYFYPTGSTEGFPVKNRTEILNILRKRVPEIFMIDIALDKGIYYVLAIFKNDVTWICVGTISHNIE